MSFAFATFSVALARPNTTTMTCAEATAAVSRAGVIVLSTGEFTYDRFVSGIQHCMPRQTTAPAIASTRDNPSCNIGFVCTRQDCSWASTRWLGHPSRNRLEPVDLPERGGHDLA